MHEFIYKQAQENVRSSSIGCFIKGTLVETEEGWTPIDELKVGDWVMSRPENGLGEAVPKRVVNTFCFEGKEVWDLAFSTFPRREGGAAAFRHPRPPILRLRRSDQPVYGQPVRRIGAGRQHLLEKLERWEMLEAKQNGG